MNSLEKKDWRLFGLSSINLYFTLLTVFFFIVCFYFIFRADDKKLLISLNQYEYFILTIFQIASLSALTIASFYAYQLSKKTSFLYLGFVWVAHDLYKLFSFGIERLGDDVDKVFLIGITALVADLPLFLSSFSDKHRKWWVSLFPIITFISMVIVFNLGVDVIDPSSKKKIVYIFSPLQSFLILIWLTFSTIFYNIFSSSGILSRLLAITFIGLAISQIPVISEGVSSIDLTEEEKLPWKRFNLGVFLYTLVIVFFIVKDELSRLNKEKDLVIAQLKVKGEFEDLGYLAASIEHELRNPLEVIKNEIDDLNRKFQHEESLTNKFHSLEIQVNRISLAANIIRVLRLKKEDFAKRLKGTPVIERLRNSVKYVKKELPLLSEKISITENEKVKELFIRAFPPYLEQTFVNLLKNSYEAIDRTGKKSGEIIIDLYLIDKDTVGITFRDNGGGFVPEDIPKLTQPDYTKKDISKSESNRGLGLFVCDKIVHLHNGNIFFSNNEKGGAEVKLEFPRHFTNKMLKSNIDNSKE